MIYPACRAWLAAACVSLVAGCSAHDASRSIGSSVGNTVEVQLLAFNDFHGSIEPSSGSNGRIGEVVTGGAEFLVTHLRALEATNPNTLVVSAGDNIGATPLISGMFHDEPTIEVLNGLGLDFSAIGNHELDEGWVELQRMQEGGCHPVDGCQGATSFSGATFKFLAGNVYLDPGKADPQELGRTGRTGKANGPLFAPSAIREVGGVKVGFIGLTTRDAEAIVSPLGIRGITFRPEAEAANEAARDLRRQGVNAIVVLIHEGGVAATDDPNGCDGFVGPIVDIVHGMSADIDVVVSGHTHRAYVCTIDEKLVTSAASLSRLITDIDLRIDRSTGRVIGKSAKNVLVTRDVAADAVATSVIARYRPMAAKVALRAVGTASGPISQLRNEAGESPLGDVVADAMLTEARRVAGRVDVALMNSGGIRNDLVPIAAAQPGGAPVVTYGNLAEVLPFGNVVIVRTMTGDALARMLEQQFGRQVRMLQVSSGFSYRYDSTRPEGSRVDRDSIAIDGTPLSPTERYRVASVDYLWSGGDAFVAATEGTDPAPVGTDLDVFISYLDAHSPVQPGPQDRIRRTR